MIIQKPKGELFSYDDDPVKIEAFIPTDYPSNHASSLIELENGDLLCVWFAGTAEGSSDVRIVGARLKRGEEQWGKSEIFSNEDNYSLQNPFLFHEPGGVLYLFHTSQVSRGLMSGVQWREKVRRGEAKGGFTLQGTALIYRLVSYNNGHTWVSKSVFSDKPGSYCRHPIQILSNGNWIFPMYYSFDSEDPNFSRADDYSVVKISPDQGKTWTEYPVLGSRGRVQMSIIEIHKGKCIAFFRSRAADRIYKSISSDYGKTWSVPYATSLPNNNASIHSIRLQDGHIAIVFNNYKGGDAPNAILRPGLRHSISVAISEDEGETFPWIRDVETGSGFRGEKNKNMNKPYEYPFMLQSKDGNIHIVYSYSSSLGKRYCIKYMRVTENWIKTGD
jgi:predicted neuraminidase